MNFILVQLQDGEDRLVNKPRAVLYSCEKSSMSITGVEKEEMEMKRWG